MFHFFIKFGFFLRAVSEKPIADFFDVERLPVHIFFLKSAFVSIFVFRSAPSYLLDMVLITFVRILSFLLGGRLVWQTRKFSER